MLSKSRMSVLPVMFFILAAPGPQPPGVKYPQVPQNSDQQGSRIKALEDSQKQLRQATVKAIAELEAETASLRKRISVLESKAK